MKQSLDAYMVKSPYVCEPDSSLKETLDLLLECGIRHLPVVESGQLVGIVSDRDLKEALAYPQADKLRINDIMKRDVFVASRSTPLRDVVRTMQERKIGSTIVVNDTREVLGIFTTTDALGILADLLDNDDEDSRVLYIEDYFEAWGNEATA